MAVATTEFPTQNRKIIPPTEKCLRRDHLPDRSSDTNKNQPAATPTTHEEGLLHHSDPRHAPRPARPPSTERAARKRISPSLLRVKLSRNKLKSGRLRGAFVNLQMLTNVSVKEARLSTTATHGGKQHRQRQPVPPRWPMNLTATTPPILGTHGPTQLLPKVTPEPTHGKGAGAPAIHPKSSSKTGRP